MHSDENRVRFLPKFLEVALRVKPGSRRAYGADVQQSDTDMRNLTPCFRMLICTTACRSALGRGHSICTSLS